MRRREGKEERGEGKEGEKRKEGKRNERKKEKEKGKTRQRKEEGIASAPIAAVIARGRQATERRGMGRRREKVRPL
jgi:hypothetical protein